MGSLCNSPTTTTSNYAPNPVAAGTYQDLLSRAQSVASQPYTPYTGELTAPVNAQQNQGISGINAAAGQAQPYINTAAQYATQGASAISPGQIQNYENPYQQDVINSTLANINETNTQQQQALKGNAISSGAFGGDRAGIAQAELARQQGLASNQTVAGLNAQNYSQALQAAQADRAAQAQGAYTFGNLGTTAQGAALQGAGAQIQAGGLQQQTQQAQDTAQYQQYLQQLAFPYQQTQFLAGIQIPAASGLGGTQTTTPPSPNPFSQYLGLGLTALSALKRGGRVGYADGGGTPFNINNAGGIGWIPSLQIQSPQMPKFDTAKAPTSNMPTNQQLSGGIKGLKDVYSKFGSSNPFSISPDGSSFMPGGMGSIDTGISGGTGLMDFGGLYSHGGLVQAMHHIRKGLRHYDDGGMVPSDRIADAFSAVNDPSFNQRWMDIPQAPAADASPLPIVQGVPPEAMDAWRRGVDADMANNPLANNVAADQGLSSPIASRAALPPEITGGQSASLPSSALAYDQQDPNASPLASPAAQPGQGGAVTPGGSGQGFSLLRALGIGSGNNTLSAEQKAGLLSAGLGIMSGTSPHGLTNIGTGAQAGVAAARQQRIDEMTANEKKLHANLEGQKLAQQLLLHREMTPYQQSEVKHQQDVLEESKRQHQMALKAPVNLGADPRTGMPIMALPRLNKETGDIDYHLIGPNGQISDTPMGSAPNPAASPGPNSALPGQQPIQTAALETGTATDAPKPGEGTVQYNTRLAQSGAYNYGADAPYIEKGMDVPEPESLAGRSVQSLKTDAESFLQTGKLPPVVRGNSPVALVQQRYQNAVKNYGNALAQSRGMTPTDVAEAWRTAPGMLRFVLGADGRSTVSLGTAVRHLDTMQQLTDAWQKGSTIGDWRTWNNITSSVRREFGDASVTNLQSAAKIIGPEVLKAIGVAGAGGEREREAVESIFSPKSTPDQIKGSIGTLQTLLGGQLEGRQRQAENAGVSKDRFKNLIGDRPYELLTHKGGAESAVSGQDKAALDWANENPKDPRAAQIKKRLGAP